MGNAPLDFFYYVNHPDNMTEQDNELMLKYDLPAPLERMKGIKIDVTNEENKELVERYNKYIEDHNVRRSQFDKEDADDAFVTLREQIIEKGEEIDMVDTRKVQFGKDWRELWPESIREQFSKSDGKEKAIVRQTLLEITKPQLKF